MPTVTITGRAARALAADYLAARAAAFQGRGGLDSVIADFFGQDADDDNRTWLAFMAGSEWEREYRGRRFSDEATTAWISA